MTPRQHLTDLCDRYGLPHERGERLLPLVERALSAPDGLKKRILGLVEGNLERESKRRQDDREAELDERMLKVVARLIHSWSAPDWLENWSGRKTPPISPEEGGAHG